MTRTTENNDALVGVSVVVQDNFKTSGWCVTWSKKRLVMDVKD
jgi:hypothetical protein